MTSQGHVTEPKVNKFCAVRNAPCKCGNNYQSNCKPAWSNFKYPQKFGKKPPRWRSYEAHHLLCVASINKFIAKVKELEPVVKKTVWCVNTATNMIGLPRWEHTLMFYCGLGVGKTAQAESERGVWEAGPSFQNLVQHDYDHAAYIDEVDARLERLARQVKERAAQHEEAAKDLAADLDRLSTRCGSAIKARGLRRGGTHSAWRAGYRGVSDWYLPFSMAPDGETSARPYPAIGSDTDLASKIRELVRLLGG